MRWLNCILAMFLWMAPGCATSTMADVTADVTASFTDDDTQARFFHRASTLADGRIMVSGGMGLALLPPSLISRAEVSFFDPATDQFSGQFLPGNGGPATSPSLLTARSSHGQTTLPDGRVLVSGGFVSASGTSAGARTDSVEIFDPFTGVFAAADAMAHPRADHAAVVLPDGRVFVAGGDVAGTWQVFDPATNQWSEPHELQHTRSAMSAVLLHADTQRGAAGRVLLIAGYGSGPATMEIVDIAAQSSTLCDATLDSGLDDLAAAQVDDGRVFIVGGQFTSNGDTTDACHWFDPVLDELTPGPVVPDRPGGIADHQLLHHGRFLIALGGEQQVAGQDTELSVVVIFDPQTNTWVYSGEMNQPHDDAPAIVLGDGRILTIGGGVPLLGQEGPSRHCELLSVTCHADGDGTADCHVDLDDLLLVIANWGCDDARAGRSSSPERGCGCDGDVTADCQVDLDDLLAVISNWGT